MEITWWGSGDAVEAAIRVADLENFRPHRASRLLPAAPTRAGARGARWLL